MKYVETSAKTAHNVADAYITMTKDIIAINAEKDLNVKKGILFLCFFYFMLDTVRIDDKKNFKDLNNKSGYVLYIYFIYPFLDVVKFYKILKMMCFCSI